ncbi:hypothetical protein BC629DRAFT_1733146 [Irpex lacteus]|nr:hypothetical protein BC629DRAFT_1733146 [Irpex lacteus]
MATISPTDLQSCITEGEAIRREIELVTTRCAQLRHQTEQLQRDIEVGLWAPADHAVQGVGVLCGTIEDLYEGTQQAVVLQSEERKRLVGLCKGQAAIVAERFKHLYNETTKIIERGGELSLELTAKLGESETQATRLNNLQSAVNGLKKSAEARAQAMMEKQRSAQDSACNARNTQQAAREKSREAETAIIVRNVFTFGLGMIGDWFGLEREERYADELVASCQRNLERAQQDMQDAQNALTNIRSETDRFIQLHSSIDSYKSDVQGTMQLAISLREKNMHLQNTSLDISLYLGVLVAKSETMQTKFTAAQFAKAIIDVEQTLVTSTKVKGLIRDAPDRLEGTMELIARSEEVVEAVGDLM